MFPQTSETFIANEIRQLERLGVEVRIFSCMHPVVPVSHECVRLIRGPVTYIHQPLHRHVRDLVRESVAVYRRDPRRFRRTARYVLAQMLTRRRPYLWCRFMQAVSLANSLSCGDVHHLHAHFSHGATQVAMLARMLTGTGFSFTAHARDIFTRGVDYDLLREELERAEFAITVSRYNKAFLIEKLGAVARDRVQMVYNGVDLEKFSPDTTIGREQDLVLGVGRLVEKKGFSYLLEALQILHERGRRLRCEIVGDGELRGRLQREIVRRGLGQVVELVGPRSQEELPLLYRRAAVVVMPAVLARDGNRDALPTVLLEAMACGAPIVASRLTGIPEIVEDGTSGLLVDPADPVSLAEAIDVLLEHPHLRRRFGEEGHAKVEREFDLTKNVRDLHRLFGRAREGVRA